MQEIKEGVGAPDLSVPNSAPSAAMLKRAEVMVELYAAYMGEGGEPTDEDIEEYVEDAREECGAIAGAYVALAAINADLLKALKDAKAYVDKASGTSLGVAMSGKNHPNPDGALTDLAMEGMDISLSLSAAIGKASAPQASAEARSAGANPESTEGGL